MMTARRLVALALWAAAVAAADAAVLHSSNRKLAGAQAPALLGMRDAQKNKQLRVLAFGDSITEGWIDSTEEKHPYTWRLESMLRDKLGPKGVSVQITNGGVGSAGVLDRLNDAMLSQLKAVRDAGKPYHFVVFLAGINDILLQKRSSDDIIKRMKELWSAAARDGSTVIVIPTLPTNVKEGEATRKELVAKIKAAVKQQHKAGDGSLQLLDLEPQFDWWSMSPEKRKKVFDDGVHLTDWGYQQYLAGLIFDGLVKIAKI